MNKKVKEKIYVTLTIIFIVLTFIGAGYVIVNKGVANAGYTVIPMLFVLIFSGLYNREKKKK